MIKIKIRIQDFLVKNCSTPSTSRVFLNSLQNHWLVIKKNIYNIEKKDNAEKSHLIHYFLFTAQLSVSNGARNELNSITPAQWKDFVTSGIDSINRQKR